MVQLGLQRSLSGGGGSNHRPPRRAARGHDAKYFPSEPSNKSELLEKRSPRSDEELKPTKTLKTKLLKKCRAGIEEIRRTTTLIPTSSGHQQMIEKLGDSDVDNLFDSSESDESSCESSFACFDDASFGSDLDGSHDDGDHGVNTIEIAAADNKGNTNKKNRNDDDNDDFFEEDDASDCEISLEDSFHEDHIEALKDEEERKPRDSNELLQLSFEGGMCVVEGASPSGSDKRNVRTDDQNKDDDDDTEEDEKKPSRRNRSHSRGKRRSRSHEKMTDGSNHNELSSSKSRLRSSSGGRRRPRSSDTGAPRRGSGLNRSKSSENVNHGRRPPLTRSLSSEGGLGLQRQTSRRFLERSLSKRDMMSGGAGAGAGTLGSGTLGSGGRRGQLSRSQSSRAMMSTSLSSSSSHESGLGLRRGVARSRSSEGLKLGSSSALSSSRHNEKWSSSTIPSSLLSKRRGSGVDKMSLSASVHETGTTSSSKRPSISRQRSVRASSIREGGGGGNRRDLLSRGASTTKLTDMKW